VQQVCDRVGLFGGGRLLAEVELTDLHKTEHGLDDIYNQYFGGGHGHE
jgi:ABC-2 type transport system ATP-binding protein